MNTIMNLLRAAGRAIRGLLGQVQEAATSGVVPEENFTAVYANTEWGRQWLLQALDTVLRGGSIQITTVDLTMLALFVASTLLAKHASATRTKVPAWRLNTTS